MSMTNKDAMEILKRHKKMTCHDCMHPQEAGWCENHCQLPEAFDMAITALEKEAWKEEHPVSSLHLNVDSDPPTEDNSCMYCNKRMECYRYITWLGDPDPFAPKVNGCDKFDKNKN